MADLFLPLALTALVCLLVGFIVGRRTAPAPVESIDPALAPIGDALTALADQLRHSDRAHAAAQAELRTAVATQLGEHAHAMLRSTDDVRREASQLRNVLGRTGARGRWGEMQLRRLVEAAGLLDHVHFDEQSTHRTDDATLRPDMVVHLSGDRDIVIDAKVPLAAFLSAEATSDADAPAVLAQHTADVIRHIDALSSRNYQDALPRSTDVVIMFLPAESLLAAALGERPDLLEYAFARNIVPATPSTLFALLRTAALGWREERLAQNADEIQRLGKELHSRLGTLAGHVTRLGSSLDAAVGNYNKAIGSLESRVLVTARAFSDLGIATDPLPTIPVVTEPTRSLAAVEFVAGLDPADVA